MRHTQSSSKIWGQSSTLLSVSSFIGGSSSFSDFLLAFARCFFKVLNFSYACWMATNLAWAASFSSGLPFTLSGWWTCAQNHVCTSLNQVLKIHLWQLSIFCLYLLLGDSLGKAELPQGVLLSKRIKAVHKLAPGAPETIGQHLLPEKLQCPSEFLKSRKVQLCIK